MIERTSPTSEPSSTGGLLAPWLMGLRWAVIALLVVSLPASSRWLGLHVTWSLALPAVAALAFANVALFLPRVRALLHATPRALALGVLFDMAAIAVVLAASGGPANPFSALLFVYVALAASLLPPRITYGLAATAALTFGALFLLPRSPDCACHARGMGTTEGAFSTHLLGMWVAFALAAALVVYFLTRVRSALEERDRALERLARRAEESAKFAAIGTLAAGAAHELATPLGTMAILAGEIEAGAVSDLRASARSIAAQVDRCREVLRRMQPGAARGLSSPEGPLGDALASAVDAWKRAHPDAKVILDCADDVPVSLPRSEIEAALSVLLDNALFATEKAASTAPIVVSLTKSDDGARMSVADGGTGVPDDAIHRIGEPFFTTKDPGEGMGLGLYLVRSLVEEAGGRLEISPHTPRGTRVSLHLKRPEGA